MANKEQSASEKVYSFLHKKITEMQIMPGAVLNPKELGEFLQVSRSPIRDAFIRLEKESLVETAPQKGTYVSKIDVSRVLDERFMRACIEEKIVISFCELYRQAEKKAMEDNIARQKEACKKRDARLFLQLDDQFHAIMYHATGHAFCLDMIRNFSGHYHRIRLLSLSDPDICCSTIQQHEQLLNLIVNKELPELQKQIYAHITEKGLEVQKAQRRFPAVFSTLAEETAGESIWEGDFLQGI